MKAHLPPEKPHRLILFLHAFEDSTVLPQTRLNLRPTSSREVERAGFCIITVKR